MTKDKDDAASTRFFGERLISTLLLSGITAAALWAGSTVVQSRQDNAVLLSRFENLEATVRELRSDVRELRAQLSEASVSLRRAQGRLQQLEPNAVSPFAPPGYTPPVGVQDRPWPRGEVPPGPNQGGR